MPEELRWLAREAARCSSAAEVGVLHGRSAFALLTACPGPVYCVDPWAGDRATFAEFMGNCGHFPNLRVVAGRSPEAAERVPVVDMVFIDANHERSAVLADLEAWESKAHRVLCGHDLRHPDYPGVSEALADHFGDGVYAVETGPGTIWAVRY